jgi:hypothetical protein
MRLKKVERCLEICSNFIQNGFTPVCALRHLIEGEALLDLNFIGHG